MKTEVVPIPEGGLMPGINRNLKYRPLLQSIMDLAEGSVMKITPDKKTSIFAKNFVSWSRKNGVRMHSRIIVGELYIWADKPEAVKP